MFAFPRGRNLFVVAISQRDLKMRNVAHKRLPRKRVPLISLKRLTSIAFALFYITLKSGRSEPCINPLVFHRHSIKGCRKKNQRPGDVEKSSGQSGAYT